MSAQAPGERPETPRATRTREHLANERTLLAWLRTALALMGLGFVVARFGVFLRSVALQGGGAFQEGPLGSEALGVALVAAGVVATAVSLRRFLRARSQIEEGRFVPELFGDVLLAAATVAVGAGLVVYLLTAR
jgi:putative membrane protein